MKNSHDDEDVVDLHHIDILLWNMKQTTTLLLLAPVAIKRIHHGKWNCVKCTKCESIYQY